MDAFTETPATLLAKLRQECSPPDYRPRIVDLYADDGDLTPRVSISLHDGSVFISVNRAMQALARLTASRS